VALHFEADIVDGTPTLSNETTSFAFFTLEEIGGLEMFGRHKERILDTLERRGEALIK
jgi:hypothetical protein